MLEIIFISIVGIATGLVIVDAAYNKAQIQHRKDLPSYLEKIHPRPLNNLLQEPKVSDRLKKYLEENKAGNVSVILMMIVAILFFFIFPSFAFANGVETSLQNIKNEMMTIIRILAVMGLIWAGGSFLFGKPEAKQHMIYAIIGSIVAFGAESIVSLVQSLVK